ncbi:hypothetical protein CRI94_14375 [Longibacter salinarum]|uniref:Peptidase S74 domain-containing protein n=1 Tax=Longibacter salinarum TaxID=1850348 RepID=A0A2A8CUG5_9BACT|nr:hypothetical protein [Longibacter salinarum]PEN12222.1 hypothetical protein CRI94_14375 [Longibacter salinarum]
MPIDIRRLFVVCLLLAVAGTLPRSAQAQKTPFTYQGYLEDGGAPASGIFDFRFRLYDAETNGSQLGTTIQFDDVQVNDGVFAVELDFGKAFFSSNPSYLEVAVRDGASTDSYTSLSPREAMRPTPASILAQRAMSLPNVSVDGNGKVGVGTTSPTSPLTVNGAIESTSGGIIFPDGTTQTSASTSQGNVWMLGGNSGTDPSTGDVLGTTDDSPLELHVNGTRGLRIEPATDSDGYITPNVIAGHPANSVASGVDGATIAGGGSVNPENNWNWQNEVTADHGTIGGGQANVASGRTSTISGGYSNDASGSHATIAGGRSNTSGESYATVGGGWNNTATGTTSTISGGGGNEASAEDATVSGGEGNTASDSYATVAGGRDNTASGFASSVGGGSDNIATGTYAIVAGGYSNEARARNSFAAGEGATVEDAHEGTFVWSDNSQTTFNRFVSTAPYQFLIRAAGGVGIGTNAPLSQLHVEESITGSATLANHVATIENTSASTTDGPDVLALKTSMTSPDGSANFVTFYDGNDSAVGSIEGNGSGGVVYTSGGADFAEMLPHARAGESLSPGDVVGMIGGEITQNTDGADRLMVITDRPAVLGNIHADNGSPVAFVGQVPVTVEGTVNVGDLLVASGKNDGTARAVAPDAWSPDTDGPIAGRAWTAKQGSGRGTVTAEVGLSDTDALVQQIQKQREAMNVQQAEIDALREQVQQLQSVHERLRRLEAAMDRSEGTSPSPARR